ncbi:MAG: PHP domain-containing protein [Clostridia bacterium]|nr:PHP domain-containing protein [Clostridia bacterium]
MKKHLLTEKGNFYKANLHCHTNLSDGLQSPAEVKDFYKSLGYSVVAYTDHDVFIPHNDLTDDNFVALNGFEMEFANRYDCYANKTPWDRVKQCHVCLIAPNPSIENQPFYPKENYVFGNAVQTRKLVKFNPNDATFNFERWYDHNCINYVMQTMRDRGYFITYNHPTWSLEDYNDYTKYKGMHALEIINGSSKMLGNPEYNPNVYDDILRNGNRINVVASDDNHRVGGTLYSDCGRAWTMIKAEKLTYDAIITALLSGDYYASEGPEISELYVEDGVLKVKCSSAQAIKVNYEARKSQIKLIENNAPLTEAEFTLSKDHGYFRVTVVGLDGKKACTSAYYPEDLGL